MDSNNKYTKMQRDYYNKTADLMAQENHKRHDSNPDYYGILLKDVKENPEYFKALKALDFGCGCGRNVKNLINLAYFARVDGCDISNKNLEKANNYLEGNRNFSLFCTDGLSVRPAMSDLYNFVMSTIVLQHICVHKIRLSILRDIYRVMKDDGIFSFQMAQYNRDVCKNRVIIPYYQDFWDAKSTNGKADVSVDNPVDLINDLEDIGFRDIDYTIRPEWDYKNEKYFSNGNKWIFVHCIK